MTSEGIRKDAVLIQAFPDLRDVPFGFAKTQLLQEHERRVGASVDQMDGIVTVTQGGHISIDCHYKMSSDYRATPFWYIQPLGEHPRLLLSDFGNGNLSEQFHQGFEAKHERKNKTYNLEKKASQLNDSAVYFCAVSDTVGWFGREANRKLARNRSKKKHLQ
uniref:Immunoglobulin V-set domain-containing protein n=1 Tax=Anolis carolinensis TaxID=28377 RepID=A0A803TRT2_ANOCA